MLARGRRRKQKIMSVHVTSIMCSKTYIQQNDMELKQCVCSWFYQRYATIQTSRPVCYLQQKVLCDTFLTSKRSSLCICRLDHRHHQDSVKTEIVAKNLVSLEDLMREVSLEFKLLEDFRNFCCLFVQCTESNSTGRFFLTVQPQCDSCGERIEVNNAMWLNFRVKALRITKGSFTTLFLSLA